MNYTLKVFNTWQVTLPKKWRSNFDTDIYIAEETSKWLLISPIIRTQKDKINDDWIEFFEDETWMSVKFKKWIEASKLIEVIKKHV